MDIGQILTVFLNGRRRRKLLTGFGDIHPQEFFLIFTPYSRLSWISKPFSRDIGQILTWKAFFFHEKFIHLGKPADFRKTGETGVDSRL